jgi:N-acetylmuramoyl-L-alanine amidase
MPFEPAHPPCVDRPLPYVERLARRSAADIDLVVVHCTELPDLAMARDYGERVHYPDSGTGNSGHYYIDRDGRIECWVEPLRVAHHVRGHNPRSIGIELVNRGRFPDWFASTAQRPGEDYPQVQIDALLALIAALRERFPTLERIAGHEDLDLATVPASDDPERTVRRKIDPGPRFPWNRVMAQCRLTRIERSPSA